MATKKTTAKKATATRKTTKKSSTAIVPAGHSFDDMIEQGVDVGDTSEMLDSASAPTALAAYSQTPNMGMEDLFIPRLRLAQGLTTEVQNGEAKPGDWLILGEDPMKVVEVIPVGMTRRRELRDNDERTVACRSNDSVTGVGQPGGECASCPMAKWIEIKTGKNKGKNAPPPCSFIYSYMVYVVNTKSMAILEFTRTSIPTGKMLNTMIAQKGLGSFAVKLGSSSKNGPRGTFHSPTVSASNISAPALKAAFAEMKKMG